MLRRRRAGYAARIGHRQLRPGDAAVGRRGPEPRRNEQGEGDQPRPGRRRGWRRACRDRQADPRRFAAGNPPASLDLQHRVDRRLHRRRLRRHRFDQLGRAPRHRQRAGAARRHHGGGAPRPRTEGPRPRQGDARLRHQRHHHRSRDPARRRLRLGRRHGRLRRVHEGRSISPTSSPIRTGFSSRKLRPSRHRCPTTISCATRNS